MLDGDPWGKTVRVHRSTQKWKKRTKELLDRAVAVYSKVYLRLLAKSRRESA
jgi:hypothetical protein